MAAVNVGWAASEVPGMKFWFVNVDGDMIFSVDTETGDLAAATTDMTVGLLPDVQRLGGLVKVGDELWARYVPRTPDETKVFKRVSSDLSAVGTDVADIDYYRDVIGTDPAFRYNYAEGIYDEAHGLVWVPWLVLHDDYSGATWAAFDATGGTLQHRAGDPFTAFDVFAVGDSYANCCYMKDTYLFTGYDFTAGRMQVQAQYDGATLLPITGFNHTRSDDSVYSFSQVGECTDGLVSIYHWVNVDATHDEYVRVWAPGDFGYTPADVVPPTATALLTEIPYFNAMHAWPLFILEGDITPGPLAGEVWSTNEQEVGAVRVVGDEMYYTSIGNTTTIGFRIWKINLLDGQITHIYDVPHFWVLNDGTTVLTEPDPELGFYQEVRRDTPHAMVVGPADPVATDDSMGTPRRTFLRGR